MAAWLARYMTTEALFSVSGAVWFLLSSIFPTIPPSMPIPALVPGLDAVTPGLLVSISLVPILLKAFNPATVPFVNHAPAAAPLVTTTTATVTTTTPPTKETPDA